MHKLTVYTVPTSDVRRVLRGETASVEDARPSCAIYIYKTPVKFSHTRHRELGPELIPVYRQVTF